MKKAHLKCSLAHYNVITYLLAPSCVQKCIIIKDWTCITIQCNTGVLFEYILWLSRYFQLLAHTSLPAFCSLGRVDKVKRQNINNIVFPFLISLYVLHGKSGENTQKSLSSSSKVPIQTQEDRMHNKSDMFPRTGQVPVFCQSAKLCDPTSAVLIKLCTSHSVTSKPTRCALWRRMYTNPKHTK